MKCKYVGSVQLGQGLGSSPMFMLGECKVVLSGPHEIKFHGWHFSISHPIRYPTWDEQKVARYELCPDGIYMVSIMPPRSEYVNAHPNCFHWHELGPKLFGPDGKPLT